MTCARAQLQNKNEKLENQLTEVTENLTLTQSSFQDLKINYEVLEEEVENLITQLENLNNTHQYLIKHSATFLISNFAINPTEVEIGNPVNISFLITNAGNVNGTCHLYLKIDEVIEEVREVTLLTGETINISFNVIKNETKTYNVIVNGLSGSFQVIRPISQYVWVYPLDAKASEYTVWAGKWYTGPPHLAIDGNMITAWTLNGMGEIIFDLGTKGLSEE